jgi:hypothetical protein
MTGRTQQLTSMIHRLERALCYMQTSFKVTDHYIIQRTTQELAAARSSLLALQLSFDREWSE